MASRRTGISPSVACALNRSSASDCYSWWWRRSRASGIVSSGGREIITSPARLRKYPGIPGLADQKSLSHSKISGGASCARPARATFATNGLSRETAFNSKSKSEGFTTCLIILPSFPEFDLFASSKSRSALKEATSAGRSDSELVPDFLRALSLSLATRALCRASVTQGSISGSNHPNAFSNSASPGNRSSTMRAALAC